MEGVGVRVERGEEIGRDEIGEAFAGGEEEAGGLQRRAARAQEEDARPGS